MVGLGAGWAGEGGRTPRPPRPRPGPAPAAGYGRYRQTVMSGATLDDREPGGGVNTGNLPSEVPTRRPSDN